MKIQELRIGNIVMVDNPKYHQRLGCIPLRVTGFEECVISSRSDHVVRLEHIKQNPDSFYESYSQLLKFIKPIPLTEEMLSEFTMIWGTDPQEPNALMVFKNGEFEILKFKDEDNFFYSNGRGLHADIIYLHQLQNLYFDLTGEELEVKL